jgi:hypothetical protein
MHEVSTVIVEVSSSSEAEWYNNSTTCDGFSTFNSHTAVNTGFFTQSERTAKGRPSEEVIRTFRVRAFPLDSGMNSTLRPGKTLSPAGMTMVTGSVAVTDGSPSIDTSMRE